MFGYFPTYSLGEISTPLAVFPKQADARLGSLAEQFARGEFEPLRQWLATNIHQHGQCYSAAELVQRVTGKPLSHAPLVRHLQAKFAPLYGV